MPWPMVHFAIAVHLFNDKPKPAFLLGSIAPDAIHVRNTNRIDKNRTHLIDHLGAFPTIQILKEFYFSNLETNIDNGFINFVMGYIAHLFADIRWTETVFKNFEEDYRSINECNSSKETYSQEVNQIDFNLYNNSKWRNHIISELISSTVYALKPLITNDEVDEWRKRTINWLEDKGNEPHIQTIYITDFIVNNFIERTSDELMELFKDWNCPMTQIRLHNYFVKGLRN